MTYKEDGTLIVGNSDKKKDIEIDDTLVRDLTNGTRDLKVVKEPRLVGVSVLKDNSQEQLYAIVVRRRRLDLGE